MRTESRKLLTVESLSVRIPTARGEVRAVERVSFELARGETLALVGESGSGKSMLCRALMGILPGRARVPGSARIVFDGRELGRLSPRELNGLRGREIGMVLQNPLASLNPVLTVKRQIVEPMQYHLGVSAREAARRALALLDQVGIPQPEVRLGCYPHQLSGGMRQRVALAIALACEPKLLIADEPTTALDVTVQAEILNLLGRLQRERQMAVLLVSHDLAVVAGRSQQVAVLYAGRIVEKAPTRQLFTAMRMPYTRALFDAAPRIEDAAQTRLNAIDGQPPDLSRELAGCPFAPRCSRAQERCRKEEPPLAPDSAGADHRYACWFPCGSPAGGAL